jgi:hypothetical protein
MGGEFGSFKEDVDENIFQKLSKLYFKLSDVLKDILC